MYGQQLMDAARRPLPPSPHDALGLLCRTAQQRTGVDGVALAVVTPSMSVHDLVYATDLVAQQFDEVQFTVGEGPCRDVAARPVPLHAADLRGQHSCTLWPVFAREAYALGVRAAFIFPVLVSGGLLGVLQLVRHTCGPLSALQCAAAADIAHHSAALIELHLPRYLAEADIDDSDYAEPPTFSREHIHIAAGMSGADLGVPVSEALHRLRAYAFAHSRPISTVAADIITRQLRLSDRA